MENAVTVRAERDALVFGLFHRLFVGSIRRKFMDLLCVFPQDVVEVNDRRVRRTAMYTSLRAFVGDPHLAITLFVPSGRPHMLFSVALIPTICISTLVLGVLVRHQNSLGSNPITALI
jgi:hypothetical protein